MDFITDSSIRAEYDYAHNSGFHPLLAENALKYTASYLGAVIRRNMPEFRGLRNAFSRFKSINLEDLK
jgi:hypothetical protein